MQDVNQSDPVSLMGRSILDTTVLDSTPEFPVVWQTIVFRDPNSTGLRVEIVRIDLEQPETPGVLYSSRQGWAFKLADEAGHELSVIPSSGRDGALGVLVAALSTPGRRLSAWPITLGDQLDDDGTVALVWAMIATPTVVELEWITQ